MNYKIKKGISSVVATALLLVVAIVSIVSFSVWFEQYQETYPIVESQEDIALGFVSDITGIAISGRIPSHCILEFNNNHKQVIKGSICEDIEINDYVFERIESTFHKQKYYINNSLKEDYN